MPVCVCVYKYTQMHIYIHVCVCKYTYACIEMYSNMQYPFADAYNHPVENSVKESQLQIYKGLQEFAGIAEVL